jgi:hypothetical protein
LSRGLFTEVLTEMQDEGLATVKFQVERIKKDNKEVIADYDAVLELRRVPIKEEVSVEVHSKEMSDDEPGESSIVEEGSGVAVDTTQNKEPRNHYQGTKLFGLAILVGIGAVSAGIYFRQRIVSNLSR